MDIHPFSLVEWNKEGLVSPCGRSYRLHKLVIEPTVEDDAQQERNAYSIRLTLSGETLFCVTVCPSERESFKKFQNAVLMSKLGARNG